MRNQVFNIKIERRKKKIFSSSPLWFHLLRTFIFLLPILCPRAIRMMSPLVADPRIRDYHSVRADIFRRSVGHRVSQWRENSTPVGNDILISCPSPILIHPSLVSVSVLWYSCKKCSVTDSVAIGIKYCRNSQGNWAERRRKKSKRDAGSVFVIQSPSAKWRWVIRDADGLVLCSSLFSWGSSFYKLWIVSREWAVNKRNSTVFTGGPVGSGTSIPLTQRTRINTIWVILHIYFLFVKLKTHNLEW